MPDHDHAYKLLFSHAEMVRDLLEGFVKEPWLRELDYGSLEKVSGSYVSDDLRERSDDVVWRVRWGEAWVYLYLLLEFQSTVEPYMAVRIQTYVGLLYQDLIRTRQLASDGRLPTVLPIVLYNGERRWSAPEELAELIEPGPRALDRYQPRARYLLIDERGYAASELAPLRNLAAALFRLEESRSDAEVVAVVRSLAEWLARPEQASLRRAFVVWINRVILRRTPRGPVENAEDLGVMSTRLEARMDEWEQNWLRQGEAQLLHRLLQRRFGALPDWVETRLQEASLAQLERWADHLLEARSVDSLLDGEES